MEDITVESALIGGVFIGRYDRTGERVVIAASASGVQDWNDVVVRFNRPSATIKKCHREAPAISIGLPSHGWILV